MKKVLKGAVLLGAAVGPLLAAVPAAAADTGAANPPSGATASADDSQAIQVPPGQCRRVTRTDEPPVVRGWGSVLICRSDNGRALTINGSAYDNRADGLCAQLYGQYNTGAWWYGPRTCPEGNTEYFSRYKEGAIDTTVYLRFN